MPTGSSVRPNSHAALPLTRRFVASTMGAAALGCAVPAIGKGVTPEGPLTGTTRFRVIRKGREIGQHTVDIEKLGAGLHRVVTVVALRVMAGPLTVYRFDHRCEEEWQNGHLVTLRSATNDDGEQSGITGHRDLAGLMLLTPGGRRQVPADLLTSNSLWSARFPQQRQILDARRGDVIAVTAKASGKATISLRGWTTAADAYDVATPHLSGTVLYLNDRWVGGRIAFGGETVAYELI